MTVKDATPMIEQYRRIKDRYPDAILFFRLGDFYEMFYTDAELAARELEITLTSRESGKGKRVPMCGVPFHSAEGYIARLIEKGYKVAICEQVEDPRTARGIVRREVVRVITPGTVFEGRILDERRNNFLAALCRRRNGWGLAAVDASTGEFMVTQIEGAGSQGEVVEEIGRLRPAECILEPALASDGNLVRELREQVPRLMITPYGESAWDRDRSYRVLKEQLGTINLRPWGCEDLELAVTAAGALLEYLKETQMTGLAQVNRLTTYSPDAFLTIDGPGRRNLELVERIADGSRKNTLLSVLDRTQTAMGGRMLRTWLERPLRGREVILARHEAVSELCGAALLRVETREALKAVYDLERLTGRIAAGHANARDLVALGNSLAVLPRLRALLEAVSSPRLAEIRAGLDPLDEVRDLIARAIVDDPPVIVREGGLIRAGYNDEVDRLRAVGGEGKAWIADLEAQERERTGIKSLKVGFNKVFGYYIEVTNPNLEQVPQDYIRKQTLANAERYITEGLKEQESLVLGAEEKVKSLEYELFVEVRDSVARRAEAIQRTARAVAELDVLCSLAEVALANGYARPEIDEEDVIEIEGGRHPVLEVTLAERFVPNDCRLDCGENRLLVITGPNMAGKSAYMRMVALIVVMAQAGSFVPASRARIGLVDRLFTRVGAADDLAGGQSTFMVEMTETAHIIQHATRKSLIVLDEVGRGTSTFDGLSIAWAIAEYIARDIGSRTMFATHYHELTELARTEEGVKNYNVAVREKGEEIIFLRRVVPGATDRSYGIQVARLAGLPHQILDRAASILTELEQDEEAREARRQVAAARQRAPRYAQIAFLPSPDRLELAEQVRKYHELVRELRDIDVMSTTPLQALQLLYDLKARLAEIDS